VWPTSTALSRICRKTASSSNRRVKGRSTSNSGTVMRICRFDNQRVGVVEGDDVIDVTDATKVLPPMSWPLPCYDVFVANWPAILQEIIRLKAKGERRLLSQVSLLSPIANPNKIIGIAGNRKNRDSEVIDFGPGIEHNNTRREADPPRMFLKANSALCGC